MAYHLLEGWNLIDSLYFSVITLATVGYGDLVPTTPIARIFTIFYVINGISILLALLDRIRVVRTRRIEVRRQINQEQGAGELSS
jgi:voltage-gated potassium channel Kch